MYNLSNKRSLLVQTKGEELNIVIQDEKKSIVIPAKRWLAFVVQCDFVEKAVQQLKEKQYVKFFQHIGGGWYVSVTTGFQCVDIRRFYKKGDEIKPTRDGLALRLPEWNNLRPLELSLPIDVPTLAAVHLCSVEQTTRTCSAT